jgi:hypothetical protein
MAFFEKNTSSLAKTYYDKWLSVATDGNVSYAAEYDTCFNRTRVRFTCKCGSMLELKPSDMMDMAVAIPFEVQEFTKLHKHDDSEEKRYCPNCYSSLFRTWNRYLCMKGCHPVSKGWDESQTLDAAPTGPAPINDPKPAASGYTFKYTSTKKVMDEMEKFGPGHIVDVGGHEKKVYQYLGTNKSWEVIAQPALKKSAPALKKGTGRKFR